MFQDKYEITTGSGFFYTRGNPASMFSDAVIDAPVDGSVLRRALELTQRRFPYFSVKIAVDEEKGRYILVHSDEDLPFAEMNGFILPGTEAANGFLLSVTYYGCHILIQIFHGLTDGLGFKNFSQTLVRTYFECLDGKEYSCPCMSVREDPSEAEYCNPYEFAKPIEYNPIVLPKKSGFAFSSDMTDDAITKVYRFSVPEKTIKDYARDYDGGVSGLISLALARAIDTIEAPDMPIYIACPMDMRKNLGCRETLRNCTKSTKYEYTQRLRNRPYYDQLSIFRGQLMIQSQAERQIPRYIEEKDELAKLNETKTIEEKLDLMGGGSLKADPIVSYIGAVDFGELNDRVLDFALYTKVYGVAGMCSLCTCYKGKCTICASYNLKSTKYIRMFRNEMMDFSQSSSPLYAVEYDSPAVHREVASLREENLAGQEKK